MMVSTKEQEASKRTVLQVLLTRLVAAVRLIWRRIIILMDLSFSSSTSSPQQQQQQRQEQPGNAPTTDKTNNNIHSNNDANVVQVYILLGQSNMLGMGQVCGVDKDGTLEHAVLVKKLYPYLVVEEEEEEGSNTTTTNTKTDTNDDTRPCRWTTSQTVRNVRVMNVGKYGQMHVFHNEFLTVRGDTIGPELGIGHVLQAQQQEQEEQQPIMLLKSCIGNRSLGWDLLPPKSPSFRYKDRTYAGYGQTPASWPAGTDPPPPPAHAWYAGKQYDLDTQNVKSVLANLDKFYPNATQYRIAGFFWWQGDKDRYDTAYAARYETNLVRLIRQLKVEFQAPSSAKFVLATLGQTDPATATGNEKLIFNAMMAVSSSSSSSSDDNDGKYPDLVGNVATVYSHPLSKGGASNSHYGGNAETYMNIGEAMGQAMVDLMSRGE